MVKTRDEIELLKQASSIGDAAMWKIKYEWLKPGVREREIEAKVHEFMLERGCEIIYDIIVASGGNTSPYRRWATDKLIRQGDLVIVDINAVGPSGYFIDFVRCFKCARQKMTQKEIDLYREVYDSMYAGLEKLKPGNTTADVAVAIPRVRRRQVRHGDAAAVRAQHRHHAVRGHVDLARLFAEVSGGDQGEHVLRHRDLRGPSRACSRPRASKRTCSSPARARWSSRMMEHMEEAMKQLDGLVHWLRLPTPFFRTWIRRARCCPRSARSCTWPPKPKPEAILRGGHATPTRSSPPTPRSPRR